MNNDKAWAEKLGIDFDPNAITPPPIPPEASQNSSSNRPTPPPMPGEAKPTPPPTPHSPHADILGQPKPKTYMLWSILSAMMFALLPGIIAIYYSAQVSSRWYAREYERSERAAYLAQCWIIAAVVLGIVPTTILLILNIIG